MSGFVRVPAGTAGDVAVLVGPTLLQGVTLGPGLREHRSLWPEPPEPSGAQLVAAADAVGLRGRGGAAFPTARKLEAVLGAGSRRVVVVNASEGEPASAKDASLLLTVPHLVLDGATVVATALGSRTVDLVVAGDRPAVIAAVEEAVAERRDGPVGFTVTRTTATFVGGQTRSVVELLEGRENLPVTGWQPVAISGVGGRPTFLSNVETFAQLAVLVAVGPGRYAASGTTSESGTALLTVAGDGPAAVVLEVPYGAALTDVLTYCGFPAGASALVGGYHGAWLTADQVARRSVSRTDLASAGAFLGAGVVLPVEHAACPVVMTATIAAYLAARGARRCGPCRNGLPALAEACATLAAGAREGAGRRVLELAGLVDGRGACAHPNGTSRLVRSLVAAFPREVEAHDRGGCAVAAGYAAA